jgi:N-acetyl-anhydromuramyl-L-alanine amidase AmpD
MENSMSFQDYVTAVANTAIEFPQLKAAMLAQAIMESGREDTQIAKEHNNHHGMKWRAEMQGYATSVYYKTGSEPTGGADFCKFENKEAEVKGYWHFLNRSPYAGWKDHAQNASSFLAFICPIWCPAGYTAEWKAAHGGLSYHQYVLAKLLPEAEKLLSEAKPDSEAETITKIMLNRKDDGTPVATAYAGDVARWTHIVEAGSFNDFCEWCQQFVNIGIIGVEDTTKAFPKLPDYGVTDPLPPEEKTEWIPFAKIASKSMKTVEKRWPKYLIIHWTAGEPSQSGEDGIASGVKSGYTYLFLPRDGQIWQGAPTHAGGYHAGNASVSSYDCLGVEVANAGKVEKIGELFVPWFAKGEHGAINKARCIPAGQVIYDADGPEDDGSFEGYYQKYTEAQVKSLTKLALYCVQVLGIDAANIRGHDEIATPHGRKVDPGFSIGDGGMVAFRKKISALVKQGTRWDKY